MGAVPRQERKKNVALIHNLYYLKVLKLQKRRRGMVGGGSHQWRTLQMFLEQSEASCWNVFPLHEEARAATLLATPARVTWLGSCDRGELDQWVWQPTVTAVRSCQPGLPTRARATDLSPEEERRRPSSASDIWSLPHTRGGIQSLQSRRCCVVEGTEVTHADGHIHPRACSSACTLCNLPAHI